MQYKLVIFDMDGTILDTLEDLAAAGNHALGVCGMPQRTVDEVRQFVGNGIRNYLNLAVPEGTPPEEVDRVQAAFTAYYAVHCADRTAPYPGMTELLGTLRSAGIRTAVVSNKPDYGVQALCAQYFPGLFDAAAGEREGVRRKPAPDAVEAVLE
ncbi:MAG: HAD hydrolase-like protein, partial [Oscillospiraceae bacterium]|nr:HAD hydrolase-like protein [Oscillospiraceae bacterium]